MFGYSDHYGIRVPWRETCAKAGIPYLTPHEAGRHGFPTEMMNRRKQADITAAKLGHWKDPAVLLKRYVHAGKLPQVAEAIFGEGAERSGTALTHARGRAAASWQ